MGRIKRYWMLLVGVICIIGFWVPVQAEETKQLQNKHIEQNLYARGAVLMDGDSGRILYGKNADVPYPMASTTKIMTLLIALENNVSDQRVVATERAAAMPEVRLGVRVGESYRMEDLYYAMMLESFNDAAVMIAEGTAGSVEDFAAMMNEKALSLGCSNTYFITPNGLDAADEKGNHHSSAEDMAKIMRYAIQNQRLLKITQTQAYQFTDCEGKRSFYVHNKNALLTMTEGVLSGKTGYTAEAGYCYVCAVEKDDRVFVIALLGSGWPPHKRYKWTDVQTLLDYGEQNYHYQTIDIREQVPDQRMYVADGQKTFVRLNVPAASWRILLSPEDRVHTATLLPGQLKAPVSEKQPVGRILLYVNDFLVAETHYTAADAVDGHRRVKGFFW